MSGSGADDTKREWDARIRSEESQALFQRASETWGGSKGQVEKAIEEFEELIDALEAELEGEPDHRETLKEIVDARVMLGQLALYRTETALAGAVEVRMDRLKAMVENASHLRADGGRDVDLGAKRCPVCGNKTLWLGECSRPDCEGPEAARLAFDGGRDVDHRLRESIKQGRLFVHEADLGREDFADVDAALDILEAVAERRGIDLPPEVGE